MLQRCQLRIGVDETAVGIDMAVDDKRARVGHRPIPIVIVPRAIDPAIGSHG